MTCGIYCYIDKKDDTIVYVGKDSNIDKEVRHKTHFASSNYNKQKINRVLQNNPNRYTYQVLAWNVADQDTLNALETQYITHLNPKFNFTAGGEGIVGYKHTDEAKIKMSNIQKGKNNNFYGKKHTQEVKDKISDTHKGKQHWLGYRHTEESKAKISESLKGNQYALGYSHNLKSKIKMSNSHSSTGFYCVYKYMSKNCKQGFTWRYQYYDNNKKRMALSSIDLFKLKEKVEAKGLTWKIIDEEKAQKTLDSLKNE